MNKQTRENIISIIKDMLWWIGGEPKYWDDAESCERRLCRFCGSGRRKTQKNE